MNIKKMISSLSQEKKAAVVFVFASALGSGLNILTTPLFTRIMPVADYGLVSLYNSWYQVLYVFASFSVTNAVANVGFYKYPEDRYGYLSSSLGITTLFSAIVAAVLFLFREPFFRLTGLDVSLLVLMLLSFIGLTALNLWIVLQKYELKYKLAFVILLSAALLSTGMSVALILNVDQNYAAVKLWSTNGIQILIGFVLFGIIVLKGKKFFDKDYWKFILVYNGPLLLHYLAQFILSGSDKIMIGYFEGETEVAIYSLAYSVASMLMILWYPVNSVLIPNMHRCIREENTHGLATIFYDVIKIAGALCVIVALLAPEAIWILGGAEYAEGVYVVPVVVAGVFFTVFYNLIANVEFVFGKTHRIAVMTIIAAGLNMVLNYVFIPRCGYIAAAYTTLITYMVYVILHYRNMAKQYQKKFLNEMYLLSVLGSVLIVCLLSSVLYKLYVFRYLAVVLILIWFIGKVKRFLER